ncbi:MAG: sugar ABC transporter substrate-binding protein [Pseudomonadota bacterium]
MLRRTLSALSAGILFSLTTNAAMAFDLGVVAFQMSAETHARCASSAEAAAKDLGWGVTVLNSNGTLQTHSEQIENLTQRGVDGLIVCMSKPVQMDAQFEAAKQAGIPVISVMSGTSPHTLFDVQVNEYGVGADAALYLLGLIDFEGGILTQRFEANVGTRIRGRILDAVLEENKAVNIVGTHTMARTKSWREDVRNGMQALLLQNQGTFKGIWASFDGQAFIIDDLLREQGLNKGDVALVSIDGGPEAYRRIKASDSMMTATVAIPFEAMGRDAVSAMKRIAIDGESKEAVVSGPYLFLSASLVDASNVDEFLK